MTRIQVMPTTGTGTQRQHWARRIPPVFEIGDQGWRDELGTPNPVVCIHAALPVPSPQLIISPKVAKLSMHPSRAGVGRVGESCRESIRTMSAYERYDTVSDHYDKTRVPVGTEIIVGCLSTCPKPMNEIVLLDAGCGTGAYSAALVDRVARIAALDVSEGMLSSARWKLKPYDQQGRIAFYQGRAERLPFDDQYFDAVLFGQMLHHLETGEDPGFPVQRQALREAHRILRPGGLVVISTCCRTQVYDGYWYSDLIPEAKALASRACMPLDQLQASLVDCGFDFRGRIVPLDAVLQGRAYFDPRGPLRAEWRAGISVWSLVTPEQLERVERRIRSLDERGEVERYVAERDALRLRVGQITICYAARM